MDFKKILTNDWVEIRNIQTLSVVRSMYIWLFLVPLLAKFLRHVQSTAKVTVFGYTFVANLTLPFNWVTFYFSALAFVIANVLYQLYCPKIIKDHSDYSSFEDSKKTVQHLKKYASGMGPGFKGFSGRSLFTRRMLPESEQFYPEYSKTEDFWLIHDQANNLFPRIRTAATIAGYLGFLLITVVIGENLWYVIRTLLNI